MEKIDDASDQSPDNDSVRLAMQLAWQDHHHARDQTWKTLQVEAVLGAGLVTVDAQFHNHVATAAAAGLVIVAAVFGILITVHHRKLEQRKFLHIMNCEEYLGLHREDLIPLYDPKKKDDPNQKFGAAPPEGFTFWAFLNPYKRNTSMFILRMHLAIILFSIIVSAARLYSTFHHHS